MPMVTVPSKLEEQDAEHLAVLATKLGTTESELIRQFVVSGLQLNPVSDSDRTAHVARKRAKEAGEVLGLVVPLDPLRSRRDPDPPPKGRGRRPLARVLPLAARIPGERHTESEGLSLQVGRAESQYIDLDAFVAAGRGGGQ